MKSQFKSSFRVTRHSYCRVICTAASLLVAVDLQAQNMFVVNYKNSAFNIIEITPGGVESTFASGLNSPYGLAFNSAGDLFESDKIIHRPHIPVHSFLFTSWEKTLRDY
jgi:hypothetical protein